MEIKLTEDPFIRDVHNTFKSKPEDKITCKCCGQEYLRGDWNFYNLCDPCFKVFDIQKMRRRFGGVGAFLSGHEIDPSRLPAGTEDVDEFIKAKVCPHKE